MKAHADDRRKAGWWWADNEILDKHGAALKAGGIAIYAALCRIAGERRKAWPSYRYLAALTGMGRTGVREALDRLEAAKLISVEKRRSEEGDADSNLYVLLPVGGGPVAAHGGSVAADGCAAAGLPCAPTGLEEDSEKKTQGKNISSTPSTPPASGRESELKLVEKKARKRELDAELFVELYHHFCPSMPRVAKLTPARRKKCSTRAREQPDPHWWGRVFAEIEMTPFLRGEVGRGSWPGATFDWCMANEQNALGISEGKYRGPGGRQAHG